MHDPEVNRHLESRFRRWTLEELRDFVRAKSADPAYLFLAMVLPPADRHIGNIKLGPIDPHHRTAAVGLLVGEKDCWGLGYGTDAIRALTAHAFRDLGLRKLTAGCYGSNEGSIRAFLKAGWHLEGRQRAQYLTPEGPEDKVLLAAFREGAEAP